MKRARTRQSDPQSAEARAYLRTIRRVMREVRAWPAPDLTVDAPRPCEACGEDGDGTAGDGRYLCAVCDPATDDRTRSYILATRTGAYNPYLRPIF